MRGATLESIRLILTATVWAQPCTTRSNVSQGARLALLGLWSKLWSKLCCQRLIYLLPFASAAAITSANDTECSRELLNTCV